MPRKPRKLLKMKPAAISVALRKYFEGKAYGPDDEGACDVFLMELRPEMRRAWESHRDQILADWIKQSPCSRPFFWWDFEAPGIRRRVGGVGDLWHDVESYEPHECSYGIPWNFVTSWQVDYYNGRSRDIHGKLIPSIFKDGDFKRTAVDPSDPPCFESQAVFLDRLNFLTPVEKAFLKNHLELLEPEMIEFEEEDDE